MQSLKDTKLMSITDLKDKLDELQKQHLTEYVQRKKIYIKSMYDYNFNQE